jgi:hypothetical protein
MLAVYRMELVYERVKNECNHNFWKSLSSGMWWFAVWRDTQHIFEEHEASILKAEDISWDASSTLKKVVKIYQTACCLIPKEHNLHSHQCKNLKTHITNYCSCSQPWQVLLSVNTANFSKKITDKLTAKYQSTDILYRIKIYLKILYMELICRSYINFLLCERIFIHL